MSSKKLFVFEGQKTEFNIIKSLADNFSDTFSDIFSSNDIRCAFCTTIYSLYKTISEDEYLDMFVLLKEKEFNKKTLQDVERKDFSEIYLFFDYDGHTSNASDKKLAEVIDFFDEETEFGKIFISYPMVEALKHLSTSIDFKHLKVPAKENIRYKKIVNENCDDKYIDFNNYTKEVWAELIDIHLKKMNFIVNNTFCVSNKMIPQIEIFESQLEKHIKIDSSISVLSAFPVFLFDYYGFRTINKLIQEKRIVGE